MLLYYDTFWNIYCQMLPRNSWHKSPGHATYPQETMDEMLKAWFHHQCDPSCWICSTIHVLEEISWDTAREAATCHKHATTMSYGVIGYVRLTRLTGLTSKKQDPNWANWSTSNTSATSALLQVKRLYASCPSSANTWNHNAAVNWDAFLNPFDMLDMFDTFSVSACLCNVPFIHAKGGSLKCGDLRSSTLVLNLFHYVSFWVWMRNYAD